MHETAINTFLFIKIDVHVTVNSWYVHQTWDHC